MITVISSPNQVSSAYNQMLYNISSDKTAEPNFNFIADVYVSGYVDASGNDAIQARLKYPVQPSSTQLWFDVGNVIKNYVSYDFIDQFGTIRKNSIFSKCDYYVELGELYDVSGIPTLSLNQVRNPSSNYKQAINTIFDFEQFSTNVLNTYDASGFTFLNTYVKEYMRPTDRKLLTYLDLSKAYYRVDLFQYDAAGSVLQYNEVTPVAFYDSIHTTIDVQAVITAAGGLVAGVDHIKVDVFYTGNIRSKTLYIDNSCSQYDTYRLHWLNQLGGWDSFNFTKATTEAISVERKQYKSVLPLNYLTTDRLKRNYHTLINDKIHLESDWVTDAEAGLLQTLVESPVVWLERDDGFVAINITNSEYIKKKYLNGRTMFNISVDFEYSYDRTRQTL